MSPRSTGRLHRYTITGEGCTSGFRLIEDRDGAWVQWPEVEMLIKQISEEVYHHKVCPPPTAPGILPNASLDTAEIIGFHRAPCTGC